MKLSFPLSLCCILSLLYAKRSDAQSGSPVVSVQQSNYPNNVVSVPEYKNSGEISVQLSEVARTNEVEVTCQQLSSMPGVTRIVFVNIRIPVGRIDGTVSFNVISAGHVVKIQCTAQSRNGGSQFKTATSAGTPGYVQVTKRPVVSVCSDVIVVPMDSSVNGSVEVLFSENVTTDPVQVNCSVVSPTKVTFSMMKLKFFAKTVPVNTMKTKVLYQLESKGDPVIVACQAASQSSSTPAENLQYTNDTSQGDTAVFTFQVLQATFIPAFVRSLGRTTTGRTVSFLVLDKPATDVTEFQCSLTAHNSSTQPACSSTAGTLVSQVTSLGLTSVDVSLVTTNMTFEVGDLFKPLVVQVNGTNSHRDQQLVDITCCRRNVDPATTISLWIDVYPSVQFTWGNVSDGSTATTYSQFDPQCPCDLTVARCDIGCCCDQECSTIERQTFSCIPGFFGGASEVAPFEYGCQETWPDSKNYLAILCVVTDNNPFLGMLYEFSSSPATDSLQFDTLQNNAQNSRYEFSENEARSLVEGDVTDTGYRDGIIVKTESGFLTIPQGIGGGTCARYAPVVFLRNSDTWCSGQFSQSMCGRTSPWSALDYLVTSDARQASCSASPQVLSRNSRDNSTKVPTHIAYYCIKNPSAFVSAVEGDWGRSNENRSLFESTAKTGEESEELTRCSFDDGVSKPPVPWFNASVETCHNVVLKVEYDLYWKGVEIVQVRVKVIIGDLGTTALVGKLFVSQRFSVNFIYLKDVDLSQLPFLESEVEERSGNPGYLIGKRVLAKIKKNVSVASNLSLTVNETLGELRFWLSSSTGVCAGAKTSQISFGVNTLSGCLVKLSLNDMINCSQLRNTILRNQESLVRATHVARRGNAVLNKSDDWLPLLQTPSPLFTANASENQTYGICNNIPARLHYEILVKEAGKYQGVKQMEIIGARFKYSWVSWSFQCISHNCKSCNVTTNSTTGCTDSVQSFEVTSSVAFIPILEREVTRQKRSVDTSNICHQDSCIAELLYPLTTSYDGEKREVAIAYGLMLVALLLFVLSVTTSCLPNIRRCII